MNILLTCVRACEGERGNERERERGREREADIFIVHTKCMSTVIKSSQAFVACNATLSADLYTH